MDNVLGIRKYLLEEDYSNLEEARRNLRKFKFTKILPDYSIFKCLLCVSTAYSNCNRHIVDERLYPSPVSPQKVIGSWNKSITF